MSFTVNKLDVVFFQRKPDNSAYEQINVSGSSAIFYLDSNGILTAGNISEILRTGGTSKASIQSLGRPTVFGETLYSVDTVTVGHPNRLVRYFAIPGATQAFKVAETRTHTLDTDRGIGIGKSDEFPYVNATLDVSGTVIVTGSLTVTQMMYGSASYALTASYVSGSSQSSTSSSYSATSSFALTASNSESASYSVTSSFAVTASYSLESNSSSYATSAGASDTATSASYATSGSYFSYIEYNVTQSLTFVSSASWASSSYTSSYVPNTGIAGGTPTFFPIWTTTGLSSTSSIQQISESIVSVSSSLIPSRDNWWGLGTIIRRWSSAFIYSISSSIVYVSNIFGGMATGSSLIIQGSQGGSGSVIINPNGDPVAIATNYTGSGSLTVGGTIFGFSSAFFAGGRILVGSRPISNITSSYSDLMTFDLPADETIYTKISVHGKWTGGGPVGYCAEFFVQKGDTSSYSQPGIILSQHNNNTSDKFLEAQLLDSALTSANSQIKIQIRSNADWVPTSTVLYEVRGNFSSVA
jgi:hypothetical protein